MAGSNTYGNYRHQADACHARQIAKKHGIPDSNIILLAYDDIANSQRNPFPGIEFNKPTSAGVAGVDVYKGCKIDYRGPNVTGDNFLKVLKGDITAPGPVLNSTKSDRVFVYFTDHGGVGILGVPNGATGGYIHAADLNAALEKATYKELLFYLEACESGSIFEGLLKAPNAFAVTAANAHESSWGWYCPPQDSVNGTPIGSCLGDEFSINWLEDADVADFSNETVKQQVTNVTQKTTKSHVQQYGNSSIIPAEAIGNFEGKRRTHHRASLTQDLTDYSKSAVRTRDIEIHLAYYRMLRAKTQQEEVVAQAELEELRRKQATQDVRFSHIALAVEPNQHKAEELLVGPVDRFSLRHLDCHKAALQAVVENCGPFDDYTMRYSRLFANLCSSTAVGLQNIEWAVKQECAQDRIWSIPWLLPQGVDTDYDFKSDLYHIFSAYVPAFHKTDVYNLTGHLSADGGAVFANCHNNTQNHSCSHLIKFERVYRPYPGATMQFYRNISAKVGGKMLTGHAVFLNISGDVSCLDVFYHTSKNLPAGTLFQGANPPPGPAPPPPPPPPPSYCTNAFDKSTCASKSGGEACTWCSSEDKVHALCFTKGHTPQKDWSCGKNATSQQENVLVI